MDNKEIHAELLNILKNVDQVCKKQNLSYMLTQGTLLGAIREKGFIEWDIEDADIMMHRSDFNSFMSYTKKHPEELTFIIGKDDVNGLTHRLFDKKKPEIFVEIFVIDSLPQSQLRCRMKLFYLRLLNGMLRDKNSYSGKSFPNKTKTFIVGCLGKTMSKERKLSLYNTISQWWNGLYSVNVFLSNEDSIRMTHRFNRELLDKAIRVPFEDTELLVPIGWDYILKYYYGDDYMTPRR